MNEPNMRAQIMAIVEEQNRQLFDSYYQMFDLDKASREHLLKIERAILTPPEIMRHPEETDEEYKERALQHHRFKFPATPPSAQ